MRKATKNLLLTAAVAFGLSACSDDVTVVEPPPPDPGGDDPAELSVRSIENAQGDNLDVDDLSGNIVVVLNVESGDQQISELQLTVDDQTQTCQTFGSGALVEGAAGAQQAVEIECVLNTAQAAGECTGEQIAPAFSNGPHALGAQLVLADGGTVSATNTIDVTFNNTSRVLLAREGGNEVVASGNRYVGGADVSWHACPVMFTGETVGEITLGVSAPGTAVTIDGGLTSEAPFTFTAVAADNDGVEDAAGDPHTIEVSAVVSDEGIPLTGDFASLPSRDVHLDFTGPVVGAASVEIDEAAITSDLYSAGVFNTAGVTDGGAGVDNALSNFLVTVGGSPADTVVDGAAGVEDLEEDDAAAYDVHLTLAVDRVGNATPEDPGVATGAASFGKDATAPALSDEAPADAGVVLNDGAVEFVAVDPDLASGDAGSGLGAMSAETDEDTPTDLSAGISNPRPDTFEIDISGLADGAYVVTATAPDQAVLDPNVSETSFDFILDTSAPAMNLTTFPQGGNTQATSAQLTIGGDVSDLNGLSAATITVRVDGSDANGGGVPDGCDAGDYELDPDAGEIDQNVVDITDSADAFSETFVIQRPAAPVNPVKYCFFVNAEDTAVDRYGDAAPNQGSIQTNTDVSWQ